MTGLLPNTTYYVRSYATNNIATVYGAQQSFTTADNYSLTYSAGANGSVTGTLSQTVVGGANGNAVTAVPDEGYYFVRWSDGVTTNPRTDTSVSSNVSVSAVFSSNPAVNTISTVASTTSSTISWTSNVNGSSQVVYGLRSTLGFQSTKVFATTTSHSVTLSNLSACTRYFYQVATSDEYGQTATSSSSFFKTGGCEISSLQDSGEESAIDRLTGGWLEITNNNSLVRLTIPDNYSTTSATFQINRLAVNGITPPTRKKIVDENIFKLVAVDNDQESLTTFSTPLTFTVTYGSDTSSLYKQDTLDVYNYDAGTWTALGCTQNKEARTLTCSMSHFSVYGVFGEELPETVGSSTSTKIIYGCKDKMASNYNYFSRHDLSLCQYNNGLQQTIEQLVNQYRDLLIKAYEAGLNIPKNILSILGITSASANTPPVRNLELGMEG